MHDDNQPQNEGEFEDTIEEWEFENIIDEEWELLEEDEERISRLKQPVFKIAAVIILLAFVAFSYAWMPFLWPPHLDFLKQNKALSEEDLVRQCKPAVVNIQTTKTGGAVTSMQGTGFNLEPQGMVVTNRHVVEGASAVEVTFSDGNRLFSQDIDLIEGYDLAVVRLKGKDLPFLPVVTDQMVELGQTVTIIGNPRGFQRVSARGEVKEYYKTETGMLVFTIAAIIAPGSSGSPVLDEKGRLVGIIYATGTLTIDDEEQNRALAIPATALRKQNMGSYMRL